MQVGTDGYRAFELWRSRRPRVFFVAAKAYPPPARVRVHDAVGREIWQRIFFAAGERARGDLFVP